MKKVFLALLLIVVTTVVVGLQYYQTSAVAEKYEAVGAVQYTADITDTSVTGYIMGMSMTVHPKFVKEDNGYRYYTYAMSPFTINYSIGPINDRNIRQVKAVIYNIKTKETIKIQNGIRLIVR
jgi:hypothetical protein